MGSPIPLCRVGREGDVSAEELRLLDSLTTAPGVFRGGGPAEQRPRIRGGNSGGASPLLSRLL